MLGVEAALITSGAAGALLMQAAAVIAGTDPAKIASLPDTEGMNNEIIMHKAHRMGYDQCYRAAGAKIVEVGPRQQDGALAAGVGHYGEDRGAFPHRLARQPAEGACLWSRR